MTSLEGVVVAPTEETEVIINKCREYYTNVQKTWYMFAKSLREIRDKDIYKAHGSLNLKEFCSKEFPSINYGTIIKTIKVVEKFGHLIDEKLSDNPSYTLPAYESCYQLINAESKIPDRKHKDLVKKIFNGEVSFYRFREEMKRIVQVESQKARDKAGVTDDSLEEELLSDIGTETYIDADDDFTEEVSKDKDISRIVDQMSVKIDFLRDNFPMLVEFINKDPDVVTDDTVDFAKGADDLRIKITDFVDVMETLCSE